MTTHGPQKRRGRVRAAASIAALTLLAATTHATPAHAIVGGAPAPAAAPSDGSLQRIDSPRASRHVCGATLIAPRWAITAGHCTGRVETKTSLAGNGDVEIALSGAPVGWAVRFGSRRTSAGGRLVAVKRFVRASRTIDPEGDIALLELATPVRTKTARIATRRPAAGTPARIRGWGYTGLGGLRDYDRARSYPDVLRAATTKVAKHATCGMKPARRALCIGTDSRTGPDNMDSGGPAYVEEDGRVVLAGTVNGGNYVRGLRPSIYTDLSAHRGWIRAYTSGRRTIPRPPSPTTPGIAGSATIRPSGCAASVVRVAASRPTDPALLLTNGHCVPTRPRPGQTYRDRPADDLVILNGADGNAVARASTTRLLLATMTGTDVALYRLDQSYAELAAKGVPAHPLATTGPAPGAALTMHVGSEQTTYACTIEAVVPTLEEAGYTQRDALRYTPTRSCAPQAGTSGSPLIDPRTGQVVAIHNSHVTGDAKPCKENEPCEVAPDGTVSATKGRGYAQQVAGLAACLDAGSVLAPSRPGCTLPAGGR